MAQYKQVGNISICVRQDKESKIVMDLCNEFASLRDEPVLSAVKRMLREVLPGRIAQLKGAVK